MKIGIIGSSGFFGSNLKNYLSKNKKYDVFSFSSHNKNKKKWISIVKKEIKKKKPQIIINCSANQNLTYTDKNIKELLHSNLFSNIFFLNQAIKNKNFKGYISFGSKWELIGKKKEPLNFYAATKQANDSFFKFFSNKSVSIVSLKIFDTYGKNDKRKKFLNDLLESYKKNKFLNITSGKQFLDYVNINDICLLVKKIINDLELKKLCGFKAYTVSSKKPIRLINLVKKLDKVLDYNLKVRIGKKQYRHNESLFEVKNIFNYPGWKVKSDLIKDLKNIFDKKN